ncbi:unnamed protein product [Meloidogyne enterolobii]|uniref:Uncharacterized protein n=1 Tax=Meloidogyne enterolobii TaxID=390850 RepID=A0ACB1AF64_MELEN
MTLTCELTWSGKEMRWGYYKEYIAQKKSREFTKSRLSFNKIKIVFAGMWEEYNLINRNCADWAKEFYGIICGLT